jgi:hypothetical protein
MKRLISLLIFGSLISIFTSTLAWSQATAQISGTVRDQSGAVLPGVEIRVTQADTGLSRGTLTNETGSYVLPNLPLGPYRLEAVLPGFRTFLQSGIVLQVNASPVVNPVLEVGQVSEQVEVQANAALVETRSQGVGQVIESQRILELPLNGRNIAELIVLAGAATPGTGVANAGRDPFNPTAVSIAGGSSMSVGYSLDGATHNNPYTNLTLSMPFPDATQEFKVETSATSAQNGLHSAGSVSLVTKSGTNDVHGNLFEFVRNGKFNARNAFATQRDTLKRNQFGGTIGGPIVQNKLFFFAGYQGTTTRQDPIDTVNFTPNTAAMLAGDFTAVTSPACNAGRQITLRAPFVGNRVDPSQFSPAALRLSAKLPSSSDPCGRITTGNPVHRNQHMAVTKIDYQRSANHSIFGRYLVDSIVETPPYALNRNLFSAINGGDGLNQAFTLGDTYLFGPNVVNALRLTANRSALQKTVADLFTLADLGVKMYSGYSPTQFKVNITGSFPNPANYGPTNTSIFAVGDDLSIVRGNHQMAFGGMVGRWESNAYSYFYSGGIATFNGQITGLGMADFLTGNVFNFTQAPPETHLGYQWYFGTYANDTWKAAQRLTVSYGVRWEPWFPQVFTDEGVYHIDFDLLRRGVKSTQFRNAPPGIIFPGDQGYPDGNIVMYNKWMNFSPRVGLAWDVNGNGKTSIRAGFGTFYDFVPLGYLIGWNVAPPWDPSITVSNTKFDDPWAIYPGGNPFPIPYGKAVTPKTAPNAPFPFNSVFATANFDTKNPNVTQWNLSIQRQMGNDWLASASYMGNQTAHMWVPKALNPAVYIPGGPCTLAGVVYNPCSSTANTNQRRVLSLENQDLGRYFAFVNTIDDGGTASYHGLVLSVQRRATRGMTVNTNYTWSHCISDPWISMLNGGTGSNAYTNPNSRTFDRGNCSASATDRRHVFNVSAVAETPQFSNSGLRTALSGWRLSPIVRISSGPYLTATTSSDIALNSIATQRINQILPDVHGDGSISRYLNPSAFALPATGTLGNIGNGSFTGPGTWQFDASVSRSFRLAETQRVELRAEAFNVTNSFRKTNPITNFNSATFGQITSALDPRIMQFALKYVF